MTQGDSKLPLLVAAVMAVLVHLGAIPWLTRVLMGYPLGPARRLPVNPLPPLLPQPQVTLGRDSRRPSKVAWISYDDFRKLIAPESQTQQPALQQEVEPVPDAPVPVDPTPPSSQVVAARQGSKSARQGREASRSGGIDQQAKKQRSGVAGNHPPHPQSPMDLSDLILDAQITRYRPVREAPADPSGSLPADGQEKGVQVPTQEPFLPIEGEQGGPNPTAAARSDRESSPVRIRVGADTVVPGGVLVGDGIEIATVRPRFSMVARVSAAPDNPVAKLVFDHRDGRVVEAILVRSSGYPNVDGPVVASLYKWRARGEKLAQLHRPFDLQVELILLGHP